MTPEEIRDANDRELLRRRAALLGMACPVCDEDRYWERCACEEDLAEVAKIDKELKERGRKGL